MGVLLPDLAAWMKPHLPELLAFLLFLAALRIGPSEAIGELRDIRRTFSVVALYQIALPLLLLAAFKAVGLSGPIPTAIILLATAASVSASINLSILTGNEPAPALRLLVLGTALLPITVIPTFWLLPELGSASAVAGASLRLLGIIGAATFLAFAIRKTILSNPSQETLAAIDGFSTLALMIIVIGLMVAIGPALSENPMGLVGTMGVAFAANFGLQGLAYLGFRHSSFKRERVAFSIVAGNRNMALFLAALPVAETEPLLLFIGCYQAPMYLTPLLLGWLYRKR